MGGSLECSPSLSFGEYRSYEQKSDLTFLEAHSIYRYFTKQLLRPTELYFIA